MPEGPLSYLLFAILLLLDMLFTSSEAALSHCNRHRIKVKADEGSKSAKLLVKLFDKFDDTIITILIGTNIVNSCNSVIATLIAVKLLGAQGSLVATLVTTVIVVLFGEMIPKNFAKVNSEKWSMVVIYPITFLMYLFWPFEKIFDGLIALIRRFFKKTTEEDTFTEDDFQDVIEKIEEEGIIDEEESDIIQAAVDFGDILVKDVLTKKKDIVGIDIKDCTKDKLQEFLIKYNYSRFPVYKDSIDNIVGILHVRTYLKTLFFEGASKAKKMIAKPYYVSPQISLDEILEGYKQHKTHVAIVVDKNNKTIGMVTMKDVLEELVNDIDESDSLPKKGGVINA